MSDQALINAIWQKHNDELSGTGIPAASMQAAVVEAGGINVQFDFDHLT
jgi:hypothetical protein